MLNSIEPMGLERGDLWASACSQAGIEPDMFRYQPPEEAESADDAFEAACLASGIELE